MKNPRIVVVGSSNTDMVVKSRRLPKPGETVTGGQAPLHDHAHEHQPPAEVVEAADAAAEPGESTESEPPSEA